MIERLRRLFIKPERRKTPEPPVIVKETHGSAMVETGMVEEVVPVYFPEESENYTTSAPETKPGKSLFWDQKKRKFVPLEDLEPSQSNK